jgi:K+-transporting ATPase KdpF subunit
VEIARGATSDLVATTRLVSSARIRGEKQCLTCSSLQSELLFFWSHGRWQEPATAFEGGVMENVLAAVVSLAIAVYLLYALLRPEKF